MLLLALACSPVDLPAAAAATAEVRGIWLTRFAWSNREELEDALGELAAAGFTDVYFQVRGNFDAYYPSAYEPWAEKLTGTLGQDPGWDPLALVVDQGHALGMRVHAYINVFPLWRGLAPPAESSPRHALLDHPDWWLGRADGSPWALNDSYVFADPGAPGVRQRVVAVSEDLLDRYALDGLHLDYIRYPAKQADPATATANVTATVAAVRAAVDVPLSAAVWGVHENHWGWDKVADGLPTYHQDSHAWLADGLLDVAMPMIYWQVSDPPGERLDFTTLAADHLAQSGAGAVYPGLEARYGLEPALACVEAARAQGAKGWVLFDYSQAKEWLAEFGRRL